MNIYLGQINIASILTDLQKAFSSMGHQAITVTNSTSPIQDPCDIHIDLECMKVLGKFRKYHPHARQTELQRVHEQIETKILKKVTAIAVACDICLFAWETFSPGLEDVLLLQKQGIKVVIVFVGSDVRFAPAENTLNRRFGYPLIANSEYFDEAYMHKTLRYLRLAEAYADMVCGWSAAALRPAYQMPLVTMIDSSNIPFGVPDNETPKLLHAPSRRSTKGTEIWLQVVSDLKEEGFNFEFTVVEGLSRHEYLKLLEATDIYCGSLNIGGKADREAMAAGCVVLSAAGTNKEEILRQGELDDARFREIYGVVSRSPEEQELQERRKIKNWYHSAQCPVIAVTAETAKDELRKVLQNREFRRQLGNKGRFVIEKFCSPTRVADDILQYLNAPEAFASQAMLSGQYSFFHKEYVPEGEYERSLLPLLNETTAIVRDTPWYKRFISPMQRDGLVF